jgi:mono/diheme cytochrome c family protein
MNREPLKPHTAEAMIAVEARRPLWVPAWLLILTAVLGYYTVTHLDANGGGFNPDRFGPYARLDPSAIKPPADQDPLFAKGKMIYAQNCSPCHQPSGLGAPGQFPPVAGSDWVVGVGPARMIRLVLDGIQGPITVNGQAYNNVMVPWRDAMTDEQIAAVLTYIRGNKEWGNNAPPVKPEEVKKVREETKGRSGPWSPADLLALPDAL